MIIENHYNPVVYQRLRAVFDAGAWETLVPLLEGLSHAQFRAAGHMLAERLLMDVEPDTFWMVVERLVAWNARAMLVTLAKAAARRLQAGTLSVRDEGVACLSRSLQGGVAGQDGHLLDRRKLVATLLPAMSRPEDVESLLRLFVVGDDRAMIDMLLQVRGMAVAFVLFRLLRKEESDTAYLTTVCRSLLHRSERMDDLSFNLTLLIKEFYGLQGVGGTFSLRLQPYEMAGVDTDYAAFSRLLSRV